MSLPDREYYSLAEVAERWATSIRDIEHYGETDRLNICVQFQGTSAEIGRFDRDNHRVVPMYQEKLFGHHPLHPLDLYEIFRKGGIVTNDLNPPNDADYMKLDQSIVVTDADLAVTRDDCDRFETTYGLMQGAPNAAQISTDDYKSGLAGRPTSKNLLLEEFSLRAEIGACHDTLTDEAKHLEIWLKENHPLAPSTGVSAIQNTIRREYNRLVRKHP